MGGFAAAGVLEDELLDGGNLAGSVFHRPLCSPCPSPFADEHFDEAPPLLAVVPQVRLPRGLEGLGQAVDCAPAACQSACRARPAHACSRPALLEPAVPSGAKAPARLAPQVGGYTLLEVSAELGTVTVTEGLTEDAVYARLHDGETVRLPLDKNWNARPGAACKGRKLAAGKGECRGGASRFCGDGLELKCCPESANRGLCLHHAPAAELPGSTCLAHVALLACMLSVGTPRWLQAACPRLSSSTCLPRLLLPTGG